MAPSSRVGEELLSADDVARYLELEPLAIYRWCRDRRLPCLKLGKLQRIRRSDLAAFRRWAERPRMLVVHLSAFVRDGAATAAELAELVATYPQLGADHQCQPPTRSPQLPAVITSRTTGPEPSLRRDTAHVGS
jgi:excisionase family DNA binding protein